MQLGVPYTSENPCLVLNDCLYIETMPIVFHTTSIRICVFVIISIIHCKLY